VRELLPQQAPHERGVYVDLTGVHFDRGAGLETLTRMILVIAQSDTCWRAERAG
jgi:hypothetical protein